MKKSAIGIFVILFVVLVSGCIDSSEKALNDSTDTLYTNDSYTNTSHETGTTDDSNTTDTSSSESGSSSQNEGPYVASVNSDVFHHSWCHYVDRIKDYNKVYFSSREEAINAGYRPCKVCNP